MLHVCKSTEIVITQEMTQTVEKETKRVPIECDIGNRRASQIRWLFSAPELSLKLGRCVGWDHLPPTVSIGKMIFRAVTIGVLGLWERSGWTSDERDGTSDTDCIIVRTALFRSLLW